MPPVVVSPHGEATLLDVPAGPPLGLGGLPAEATEVGLSEGTVLALCTDGLVESRVRDPDDGYTLLCEAPSRRIASLDQACDKVFRTMLPIPSASEDVALLLARTRSLDASKVTVWDVPSDPEFVAQVRRKVAKRLTAGARPPLGKSPHTERQDDLGGTDAAGRRNPIQIVLAD